ncbi:MAG: topoisomerase IV, partial [Acetanaerobacterium sp.]
YPVNLFFTQEGYFKKITPQSLRMSGEHKLKEGDKVVLQQENTNAAELLFFTDRCQVYKARACDFEDTKASVLGDYIPAKLGMDEGENAVCMVITKDYSGHMLFFFENGKMSKVPLSCYKTKTRRKRLINAYGAKSPIAAIIAATGEREYMLTSSAGRVLLVHSGAVAEKSTKDNQGLSVMTLKKAQKLSSAVPFEEQMLGNAHRFRTKLLPSAGAIPKERDLGEQMTI